MRMFESFMCVDEWFPVHTKNVLGDSSGVFGGLHLRACRIQQGQPVPDRFVPLPWDVAGVDVYDPVTQMGGLTGRHRGGASTVVHVLTIVILTSFPHHASEVPINDVVAAGERVRLAQSVSLPPTRR